MFSTMSIFLPFSFIGFLVWEATANLSADTKGRKHKKLAAINVLILSTLQFSLNGNVEQYWGMFWTATAELFPVGWGFYFVLF